MMYGLGGLFFVQVDCHTNSPADNNAEEEASESMVIHQQLYQNTTGNFVHI